MNSSSTASTAHCFTSFCVGEKYCRLEQLLVQDALQYAPQKKLLILTSHPNYFKRYPNAVVFKHIQKSPLYVPNDKVFLIEKALSLYDSSTYLEADERILSMGSDSFKSPPGITAMSTYRLSKHMQPRQSGLAYKLIKNICSKLSIQYKNVSYIHEHLFTITKDSGKELEFIKYWKMIKSYFEIHGYHGGEGISMGLAAEKSNFPVHRDGFSGFKYYKECVHNERIKHDQLCEADIAEMKPFADLQRSIEYPQRNIINRLIDNRYTRKYSVSTLFRFFKLYGLALRDINFYFR